MGSSATTKMLLTAGSAVTVVVAVASLLAGISFGLFSSDAAPQSTSSVTTGRIGTPSLTVSTHTSAGVTLTWSPAAAPSPAPTGYTLTQSAGTLAGTCATLTASSVSCTATGLAPGTQYTWTLTANYDSWSSNPVTTSATTAGATTLDVDSVRDPSVTGQPIFITAQVKGAQGLAPGAPGNTVTFTVTGQNGVGVPCLGGTTRLVGPFWVATCVPSVPLLAIDSPYTATAHYSGGATLAPSSGTLTPVQVVNPDPTTTRLTVTKGLTRDLATSDPSMTGGHLSFMATVSAAFPGSGTPQGTVTFVATNQQGQSTTLCGAIPLTNRTATCTSGTKLSTGGPHQVTATYTPGLANYLPSNASWTQPDQQDQQDQQVPVAPTVAPSGSTSPPPGSPPAP